MLGWAIGFFLAAITAALFGFGGVASAFAEIARLLFYLFLVLFAASLLISVFARPRIHTADAALVGHRPLIGGVGALVFAALVGVGVYAWIDHGMTAERLGRIIDRSAAQMSVDASEALGAASDRAGALARDAGESARSDAARLFQEARDDGGSRE